MNCSAQSITLSGTAPVLFVSDLHLSLDLPKTCTAFFDFLEQQATHAQALFILGDLFEYWVGDDCLFQPHSLATTVTQHLAHLKHHGVALYILPGNRDFLLGEKFAQKAQATLIKDYAELHCFQQNIVLAHGDTLCTDDVAYLRYRAWVHKLWIQKIFLNLPLSWRLKLANHLHQHSQNQQKNNFKEFLTPSIGGEASNTNSKYEVNTQAAETLLDQFHASILIHGHTHRPQSHTLTNGVRWVLSDWDLDHVQRASYLCLTEESITQRNLYTAHASL